MGCTERSISVSAALLRQTSRGGHSPKLRRAGSGLRELPRCIWRSERVLSALSLSPADWRFFLFCKDERRPPRPGVHLPGGRLRGKMSLFPLSFSSANCGVKWCTAVVGLAARCGSRRKWLRERGSAALREGGVMRVSAFDAATLMLGFFSFLLPPPLQV